LESCCFPLKMIEVADGGYLLTLFETLT